MLKFEMVILANTDIVNAKLKKKRYIMSFCYYFPHNLLKKTAEFIHTGTVVVLLLVHLIVIVLCKQQGEGNNQSEEN